MSSKQTQQHTPVPMSGVRLQANDAEPAGPEIRDEKGVPMIDDDDPILTPRIVTFNVDDAVLAVVTVPLVEGTPLGKLTPVERHVASLAARGLTNAGIGEQRGKSERTIANQMASILRKLKVGSRYELAALLAPCDLEADRNSGERNGEP
ncbi:MAG: helix-turn-helix domain-containing protein [Polyangiaceae bacterium]